jgi:hypothetical protein
MWYVILLGDGGYYGARRGYLGASVPRDQATLFSYMDALQRSANISESTVEAK